MSAIEVIDFTAPVTRISPELVSACLTENDAVDQAASDQEAARPVNESCLFLLLRLHCRSKI